ncbi:MAG TPA: tetratricopeptide repeat protein [Saprospiraceae bacterium]|nr:tetratricopeptide repeat protein [Saprospiraceae bacterium]HQW54805.1 tetratricopeptide repeat protein [Saprospiraceae bacterium]
MKKIHYIISILILMGLAMLSFSSCTQSRGEGTNMDIKVNDEVSIAALLPRKNEKEGKDEYDMLRKKYEESLNTLKEKGFDAKAYITLASIYITECRITGNADYYNRAAVEMLDRVINNPDSDVNSKLESFSLKSAVYLNMHQFEAGRKMALEGLKINPGNAGLYGALVDANVELGHYKEAVEYCDKMLSIRPDLRSYSRASYLRQIYGDNQEAIDAMKLALEAGVPGNENTEWTRIHLADLYLYIGKIKEATALYQQSLSFRPDYPHAEMGLAKVEKLQKNYPAAIEHTRKAISLMSEASFVSFLGELYELNGEKDKADKIYSDVIRLLNEAANKPVVDQLSHNAGREFAFAYMNAKNYDKALEYAKKDYEIRPENIDANDLLAWVYYLKGDYKNALIHSDKVFITNVKSADLYYKASLINTKAGNAAKADQLMKEAMAISTYIDPQLTLR